MTELLLDIGRLGGGGRTLGWRGWVGWWTRRFEAGDIGWEELAYMPVLSVPNPWMGLGGKVSGNRIGGFLLSRPLPLPALGSLCLSGFEVF